MNRSYFELDLIEDTPTVPDTAVSAGEAATPAPTDAKPSGKATKPKKNRKKNEKAVKDRFFSDKRQLRVWVRKDKFERFKKELELEGLSVYRFINDFIDVYIGADEEEEKTEVEAEEEAEEERQGRCP